MPDFKPENYPSFHRSDVKILDQTTVFQGFFRIDSYTIQHKLFNGGWSGEVKRELFERGHAVIVLPYDVKNDSLVLIEQFRIGSLQNSHGPWLLEAIAGMIEQDETIEQVARRESEEEAGLRLTEFWPMLSYQSSPGGSTERIHLVLARLQQQVASGVFGLASEQEDIKVHSLPRKVAMQLLQDGKIDNAATVIALQWLALNLADVRKRWAE
ncbi:ADP-ribose diphosphatase [Rheinheimera mesophila]|uniref:ADP-ribose pyrophosphatase n=1 Tax=Rheinheimera mesophila TaxID=1547515 RepID=A0A3P3QLE6_9GAMM|nr:ADP-ribose diphosphatase [Rheinheimera mesophila]KKL01868.1 ADP-ribose pyrophosphatase [Rheinheimera mesophila]RRJ21173.1 ADP-ribose diphosphatase [Rheinheimera mesophila]